MKSRSNSARQVPVARPMLPPVDALVPYLARLDATRQYSNRGGLVQLFEQRLSTALDSETQIAVSAASGTSALVGAILAVAGRALPQRPIALIPSYTFVGTLSAVQLCGYSPYLLDIDPDSWMLQPEHCDAFDELDRVGIVVPVGAYGRAVPQGPWQEFSRRTGIPVVIDDAAGIEALMGNPTEFIGELPVAVSLHATKPLCTGEGGAVICPNPGTLMRAYRSLNFGFDLDRRSSLPGLNGKMSEYHAAVGLAELDAWPQKQAAFKKVAETYCQIATEYALDEFVHVYPSVASSYAIFDCSAPENSSNIEAALAGNRIGYRFWYGGGLHENASGQSIQHGTLANTEDLSRRLIGLPMATDLNETEVRRTLESIAPVIEGH